MLKRLQLLGWQWHRDDMFADMDQLPIEVVSCPVQEMKSRLAETWQKFALSTAQQRKTFAGAPFMHVGLTIAHLKKWDAEQQAILRAALNGTFFTADHLVHRTEDHSGQCRFCGELDSQVHRHWHCPYFDSCRNHLTQAQIEAVLALPPVVANHGWVPEPPSLTKFRRLCLALPDETATFTWPSHLDDMLYLFTDGSCLAPTSPWCRCASWGVALGSIDQDDFQPISSGVVQGWVQTAARAEILAVLSAFEFALRTRQPFAIWVDNERVYKKMRLFQRGFFQDYE